MLGTTCAYWALPRASCFPFATGLATVTMCQYTVEMAIDAWQGCSRGVDPPSFRVRAGFIAHKPQLGECLRIRRVHGSGGGCGSI